MNGKYNEQLAESIARHLNEQEMDPSEEYFMDLVDAVYGDMHDLGWLVSQDDVANFINFALTFETFRERS